WPGAGGRGARIGVRQREREGAALAQVTLEREIPAEQTREVARDREPEPGAAEAPVRGAVGLAEGLEDRLVLLRRDPDPGVAHGELDAVADAANRERDLAGLGELEGVREQVLQDLLEPLPIGLDRGRRRGLDAGGEPDAGHD